MQVTAKRKSEPPLTTMLVERIAEHKGVDAADPSFCLYEDVDPEALEILFERTTGPLKTSFRIDDASVTVAKSTDGELTVDVESAGTSRHAAD
ncbi:HalOD1 output domain-containing protein [Halorussus litoreus]|uniref:HalOD1 output domain-containing protein n=1 Tax=Halorussus litoreus TaxID=1710536 RepID=UPI000E2444A3|nr:HalOD1 output domain-containing protein [Halorussus litoreus]